MLIRCQLLYFKESWQGDRHFLKLFYRTENRIAKSRRYIDTNFHPTQQLSTSCNGRDVLSDSIPNCDLVVVKFDTGFWRNFGSESGSGTDVDPTLSE